MQPDARYTHRRMQITESCKITGGIFRVIKRDKGHDPSADKGECRNSSVETRGHAAFFRPGKAGRAQQELKASEDTTLQQYVNFGKGRLYPLFEGYRDTSTSLQQELNPTNSTGPFQTKLFNGSMFTPFSYKNFICLRARSPAPHT